MGGGESVKTSTTVWGRGEKTETENIGAMCFGKIKTKYMGWKILKYITWHKKYGAPIHA